MARSLIARRRVERARPSFPTGEELTQSFQTWTPGGGESIDSNFHGYVNGAMKASGPIFSLMDLRAKTFSEATYAFRERENGRPQELIWNEDLAPLDRPWPGAKTGELAAKAIIDADLGGTAYIARVERHNGTVLKRLRPDWVTILGAHIDRHGDPIEGGGDDAEAEIYGFSYKPGGYGSDRPYRFFLPDEVAYWAPTPDPLSHFRGMSWLTPIVREIEADMGMTLHKKKFLENAATPNMLVTVKQKLNDEDYTKFKAQINDRYGGVENAWKTLILENGAEAKVIGADFKQLSYHQVQAIGESRMASAAGVPPVLVGFSEGLQAATYSNYSQARRRYADATLRPLWRGFANALESIIKPPDGAELWYDDRDIPFLREDADAQAGITSTNASTLGSLILSGFKPETAVKAVSTGDFSGLVHSGLASVQLQKLEEPKQEASDGE